MYEAIIAFAIKVISYFIERSNATKDAKRSFYEFVDQINKGALDSRDLQKVADGAKERLDRDKKESNAPED